MNGARRATLSAAAFVLICFFLPWMQLSCVGMRDSVSGYDLARSGDHLLWLAPVFMLAIILLGIMRVIWENLPAVFALTGTVGGCLSAYLIYRERASSHPSALIAAQSTPWFWLGFVSALCVAAAAFIFYAKRSRSP